MNIIGRINHVVLLLLLYSYVIYPAILFVLSRVFRKPWKQKRFEPHVTVVISAYNEEGVIRDKILNTLSLDYPENKLRVVVGSDGSTDGTNEIVANIKVRRLRFYHFPQRLGKTACLNRMVPRSKGEIVVFTDANSMLPPGVIRSIVRNFADPAVGLVTGWTKYCSPSDEKAPAGSYARFEKALKIMESSSGSCVGADGAIFAIRKSLYRPLQDDDINDFVIPLDVIRQKHRAVLDPDVFCIEDAAAAAGDEYQRQVRITTRTLRAIRRNIEMLNPLRYGLFSFFMISHKVLRFLCPYFFISAYIINMALLGRKVLLSRLIFLGQNLLLAGVLGGFVSKSANSIHRLSRMLLITFAAQGIAWIRMIAGFTDTTWSPRRQARISAFEPLLPPQEKERSRGPISYGFSRSRNEQTPLMSNPPR